VNAARRGRWRVSLGWFLASIALLLAAYWPTVASFPRVWGGSDTYTHCFLVIPACIWLVWRKRAEAAAIEPRTEPWALLPLLACGLLWAVADAANVLIYAQLGVAAMVPLLAIALFGLPVARALTFPYVLFLLAVPFGEVLQPVLMHYTAKVTVAGLRLSGVPVWVEGLYFTTPNGHWRVIEACSGLRFLISMSTLGSLFAYLRFERRSTRILFGALAVVMPLVANGLRAYTMVMTGYLSDMKHGLGLDHFVIGWALFAAVMATFFFIGSRWREEPLPPRPMPPPAPPAAPPRAYSAAVGPIALLVLLVPVALSVRANSVPPPPAPDLRAAAPAEGWQGGESIASWKPAFRGTSAEVRQTYLRDGRSVEYYVGYYATQRQGAELIHFENVIVPRSDPVWRDIGSEVRALKLPGGGFGVLETRVRSETERYLVWSWYWIPDVFTTSQVAAKLQQARARLIDRRDRAAVVILSAPYLDDESAARATLERFVRDALPSIHATLQDADRAR
jgi:exosortase A